MITLDPSAVARVLGKAGDPKVLDLATEHLPMVRAFVEAYVRGDGIGADGQPAPDLLAVILSATARLIRNPAGLRGETIGPFAINYEPSVEGFTLLELAVLHRHRRRAA